MLTAALARFWCAALARGVDTLPDTTLRKELYVDALRKEIDTRPSISANAEHLRVIYAALIASVGALPSDAASPCRSLVGKALESTMLSVPPARSPRKCSVEAPGYEQS